jgi:hypothetical protein
MLKSTPNIKVADLKYKIKSDCNSYFGAFQLILSNGKSSPVLTSNGQDATNLQSFAVTDYSMVKRIKGSELNNSGHPLHKISFGKKDGSEITKVELYNGKPYGPEFMLSDDEEIIGIFGTSNATEWFEQLGFIVWKPPKI